MLIYEVNLEVDEDINYKMAAWLQEHIANMLNFNGFKSAYWYFRLPEDEGDEAFGKTLWTIQYVVETRQQLDDYLNNHAAAMRTEGEEKFGGKFKASRRIMTLLGLAGPADEREEPGANPGQ